MVLVAPLLERGDLGAVLQMTPGGMVDDLRIAGQDAQVGVDLGQRAADETQLAGAHAPGVGKQLADQGAVAPREETARDFEDVPAQGTRCA